MLPHCQPHAVTAHDRLRRSRTIQRVALKRRKIYQEESAEITSCSNAAPSTDWPVAACRSADMMNRSR